MLLALEASKLSVHCNCMEESDQNELKNTDDDGEQRGT